MKRLPFLAALLLSPVFLFGQFGLGLNPSKMKWEQIDTDKVQVIFPQGMHSHAQRAANIIHMLYDSSYYSLGNKQEKVSIILQNQTTVSNGFVTVSPFRSEFFTTPPQFNFLGAASWWDFLTIHEYRHVQQFQNAKHGITEISSLIFGQNGWGGATVLALPRWFLEGDATFFETAITTGGRGRTPDFDKQYRSLLLDGKFYNYEKASAFSIKDFVPNHYNLGYYMTTHVRNKYGDDALTSATQAATGYKGILYPFSRGLKKSTGLNTPQLYKETFSTLKTEWEAEKANLELTVSSQINSGKKKAFTSYTNPVFLDDRTLLVEKSGFQDIMQYVKMDLSGSEEKVHTTGRFSSLNASLSVANNKIVWAERAFDERWGNQDYSIIRTLDLTTSKKKTLKKKTKYFAPAYSPDGGRIAAVHIPETAEAELHILADETGNIISQVSNPGGYQISFPDWIDENNLVVALTKDSKTAIARINLETATYTLLIPWTTDQLSYPVPSGDYVFFNSTRTGIDNIHAVDTRSGTEYQVTSTLYGAKQSAVSPDGKKLVFSEFTSEGWDLKSMDIDPSSWKSIQRTYETNIDFINPSLDYANILDRVPGNEYDTKKFNKTSGLLQLHSWSPILTHPDYGGLVYINNKLSTLGATAFYEYNVNEEEGRFGGSLTYAEFYPVFRLGYTKTERSRASLVYAETEVRRVGDDEIIPRFVSSNEWDEEDISFEVLLPFNLSAGNHIADLEVKGEYHYLRVNNFRDDVVFFDRGSVAARQSFSQLNSDFSALEIEADLSRFQRTARQNVIPRWGQLVTVSYLRSFGTNLYESDYLQVDGRFLFPGILKTHGSAIRLGYRQEDLANPYKFRDEFFYARGYSAQLSDEIWRAGVEYSLPIWLPDVAIGPFFFIQRVKATAFFDHMQSTINPRRLSELRALTSRSFENQTLDFGSDNLSSVGADIRFDFRFLRLLDVDMGFRYSYLLDDQTGDPHQFNIIVASLGF